MSKSSVLKLYDEAEVEKLKFSNTVGSQKVHHPVNIDFNSTLSMSQENGVVGLVNSVRGEDGTHTFSTGLLDGSLTDTEQLIADEGIAYLAHKSAIENALSTEQARSIAATDVLGVNSNNATIARINHAANVTGDKLSMIADRQQAVTDYNTHVQTGIQEINTEKDSGDAAVSTRLDTLMSVGDVDATKLMDVVSVYQAADTTQLGDIAGIQADFDALKIRIDDTIALEEAAGGGGGGGGGSSYQIQHLANHYNGSSLFKISLSSFDGAAFFAAASAGDTVRATSGGGTEDLVMGAYSNHFVDQSVYVNFTTPVGFHYFQSASPFTYELV